MSSMKNIRFELRGVWAAMPTPQHADRVLPHFVVRELPCLVVGAMILFSPASFMWYALSGVTLTFVSGNLLARLNSATKPKLAGFANSETESQAMVHER